MASICIAVGFRGEALVKALAVAKAESDFDAHAMNYAAASGKWGPAVGLFQVRVLVRPPRSGMDSRRDRDAMRDPVNNARFAYDLSGGGKNWRPWSAYTNGAYRQYMDEARQWALAPAAHANPKGAQSVPLVENDWIDDDRAAIPVDLEGTAHPGDLGNRVVTGTVDLSMAEASQVTLELEDQQANVLKGRDLNEGAPLQVNRLRHVVTAVGVRQGPGSPHLLVTAQPAGVVRLRGVTPASTANLSAVQYARRLAKSVGMPFSGGPPSPVIDITPQDIQLGGPQTYSDLDPTMGMVHGTRKENAWEVLRRLAQESTGYVCFESGGRLYFATQDWLYRNSGVIYVQVGNAKFDDPRTGGAIRSIGYPTITRSIKRDSQNQTYRHVEATIALPPGPGWAARAGYRLWLAEPSGIVDDARPMLIQTVSYPIADRSTPVTVKAASYTAPGDVDAQPATVPDSGPGSRGSGTSQNGWPASPNPGKIGVTSWQVPGTSVNLQLAGRAAKVLLYVAAQFNKRVERLTPSICGGYNYRVIAGSHTISNHGSGTAIDLNWSRHPQGRHGTFSAAQVSQIRRILAECKGVVRWGGDYSGRPDEMHFEVIADPAVVKSRFG